jgi:hypothetical protein
LSRWDEDGDEDEHEDEDEDGAELAVELWRGYGRS